MKKILNWIKGWFVKDEYIYFQPILSGYGLSKYLWRAKKIGYDKYRVELSDNCPDNWTMASVYSKKEIYTDGTLSKEEARKRFPKATII